MRIGLLTDSHYADREANINRYYREALGKIGESIDRFNEAGADFVIQLGDFIDAADSVEEEIGHLQAIESEYARFQGPRQGVAELLAASAPGGPTRQERVAGELLHQQIVNLAKSVQARIQQLRGRAADVPEGGYHGEYLRDLAQAYLAEHPGDPNGEDLDAVRRFAVAELRQEQDQDLEALGIKFDVYFLETSLYSEGNVARTVERLVSAGHTYQQDGALWLKTTDFGDDKDRVMKKSASKGGDYTYFVPDVAYHVTKWERGFTRSINVQGADHHGTITRVRVGLQALEMGIPAGYPEYVLHQMVTVMKHGEELKISKRAGSYFTLRDLVEEAGADAVRYFFLMLRSESHLVFDVDLATKQSEENPVYYVQYAHTRMAGIFRTAGLDPAAVTSAGADLALLTSPEEQELIKLLGEFPGIVAKAAETLEPHRIVAYLKQLATAVNKWYHEHRVVGVPPELERARLVLARGAQIGLANGLTLLGVSAPERM